MSEQKKKALVVHLKLGDEDRVRLEAQDGYVMFWMDCRNPRDLNFATNLYKEFLSEVRPDHVPTMILDFHNQHYQVHGMGLNMSNDGVHFGISLTPYPKAVS